MTQGGNYLFRLLIIVLLPIANSGCNKFFGSDGWQKNIPSIGSSSSPRLADLTNDGVLDIVLGGGGREFTKTEYGVVALDGNDGELLWSVPARNQVVGSPLFNDVNNDNQLDVIIGGRSAILYAIDGKTGDIIWEYLSLPDSTDIINDSTLLNFYSPQFIPDQDQDGLKDILIAYGGLMQADPEETDRPVGSLKVISTKNGSLIAKADMPDGKETYMSALAHDFDNDGELSVIFGSGGETINGHFYKADLESVINEDLSDATILSSGSGKGFISPPVIIDVNGDDIKDIVVSSVNGEVFCFDGSTEAILWKIELEEELEGYTMPAPGYFNEDNTPDFFMSYGSGVWPEVEFTYQLVVDGENGEIIYKDTLGNFQYASPTTFDFTQDGYDDILVVVNNISDLSGGYASIKSYTNELRVFDIYNGSNWMLSAIKKGSNLGSTPVLTDVDNDGYLDIIYVYMNDPWNFYSFNAAVIERIETEIKITRLIKWGGYMGRDYDGVYDE